MEQKQHNPNAPAPANEHAPTPTQSEAQKEHYATREEVGHLFHEVGARAKTRFVGFFDFIREQGVMGLAIGFLLGGAVSKTVSSFVDNVVNPLIGLAIGRVNLSDRVLLIGSATVKYGAFISSVIDFVIVAAVVYFIFKGLNIERVDKKKQ